MHALSWYITSMRMVFYRCIMNIAFETSIFDLFYRIAFSSRLFNYFPGSRVVKAEKTGITVTEILILRRRRHHSSATVWVIRGLAFLSVGWWLRFFCYCLRIATFSYRSRLLTDRTVSGQENFIVRDRILTRFVFSMASILCTEATYYDKVSAVSCT